ncbi:hypothetical protein AWE47_15220 [Piscirickettsia salmonis]|uniref:helix-turn-helix domain-containing protein n=1 Tax=Piscirickettsia salmonis TaxID=1238 RepID=UPI000742FC93|nr:helix-turn-helix domain-containing protein [Piscirickettsia salmonis]ALY04048.1 hypothetical protein AWE47_15220 [Piscirickettsia salmonis]
MLESADPEHKRFLSTTIASRAIAELSIKNNQCEYSTDNNTQRELEIEPFAVLRAALQQYQAISSQVLPGVIGGSFGLIARALGFSPSTISREIKRHTPIDFKRSLLSPLTSRCAQEKRANAKQGQAFQQIQKRKKC